MVGHGVRLEMENAFGPQHSGGLVMIWGCMTIFGPGAWHRIEGKMDRHLYKFILEIFSWSTTHNYN